MYWPEFNITNRMNNALVEIERARGFLEAANLKEDWVNSMQSEALVREAHHSTHIEGSELTLTEARRILEGVEVRGARRDDRQELLNYKEAMDLVSDHLGKRDDISEGLVKDIHRILVKDVRGGSLEPGMYRSVQNYVVNSLTGDIIYTPPPPSEVPALMAELIDWLNGEDEISPVFVAGAAQFKFVDIHPFLDGNGRTARLLCTLVLYQNGYDFKRLFSLSEYYDKGRRGYYESIQSVRESGGDLTGWLEYFTEGLRNQLAEVKVKGLSSMKRDLLVERIGDLGLNDRQILVLEYLVDHPRIDNTGYQRLCGTIKRTATRDLAHLVELGLLERHGVKKGTYYTPSL